MGSRPSALRRVTCRFACPWVCHFLPLGSFAATWAGTTSSRRLLADRLVSRPDWRNCLWHKMVLSCGCKRPLAPRSTLLALLQPHSLGNPGVLYKSDFIQGDPRRGTRARALALAENRIHGISCGLFLRQ